MPWFLLAVVVLCFVGFFDGTVHARGTTSDALGMVVVLGVYAVLALVMVFVFPGNPDPVPVPIDLLELFPALTMAGQFLMWALLAAGVTVALWWHQRSAYARTLAPAAATGLAQ